MSKDKNTVLIFTQVYVPDPAAVGQYIADAASELVKSGKRVIVYTANRGYDDPTLVLKKNEIIDGVEVRRLPFSSFGKKTILHRLVGQLSFLMQCIFRGVFTENLSHLLVSTSPPMCAFAAISVGLFRSMPITYWVMDLNPDQVIEMGIMKSSSLPVKCMDWLNRRILKRASNIVCLDRFMADRVCIKYPVRDKISIIPPWPLSNHDKAIKHADNPFRKEHDLDGKIVIMYSGNHSPANPLETIVQAALKLESQLPNVVFMFVGGGKAKQAVEAAIKQHNPKNIISLPYQPLEQIQYSLSAADVHVVSVGPQVVGIVHPCKVYGAMALGRPVLLLGPKPCHVSDLIDQKNFGWHVQHGEVDLMCQTITQISAMNTQELTNLGDNGLDLIKNKINRTILTEKFCKIIGE